MKLKKFMKFMKFMKGLKAKKQINIRVGRGFVYVCSNKYRI